MQSANFENTEVIDAPPSIRHIVAVLRAYLGVIVLAELAIAVGVALVAVAVYLTAPEQRVVSVPFRLEFKGAGDGTYPNGLKFSTAEIVNTPILLDVYKRNDLQNYTGFSSFAQSVFVLEQNVAYERLRAQYEARLADTRLSPIDRERVEKEFDEKIANIRKSDYSVNLAITGATSRIPLVTAKKAINDVLDTWARTAVEKQGVLKHDVPVISSEFLQGKDDAPAGIGSVMLLRTKGDQLLNNIDELSQLPGVHLVRTRNTRLSLAEIRLRVEDILRYRVEPLVAGLTASPAERAGAIQFTETQLAYDQRRLDAAQQKIDAIQQSLLSYTVNTRVPTQDTLPKPGKPEDSSVTSEGGTIATLSESFLDRLVQLATGANDQAYRRLLVDQLRAEMVASIPIKSAVEYDRQLIAQLRGSSGGVPMDPRTAAAGLAGARNDLAQLTREVNEIYLEVSRSLSPSTQIFRELAPPMIRTERAVSLSRLALFSILALLAAIPVLVIAVFLHHRMRHEEMSAAPEPAESA